MKSIILVVSVLFLVWVGFFIKEVDILENIKSPQADSESDESSFTLITTGDVGLGRYVNYMIRNQNNPNYPFLNISDYLNNSDFAIVNLESPLISNCPIIVTGFKFCGNSENVNGLVFAGVDAANLANNHTTNYGLEGLNETKELLNRNGIIGFGVNNEAEYVELNGYRIGLVGFVELGNNWGGLNNATDENVANLITKAKQNSDIVITAFHWGSEYTHFPSENQKRLAKLAIDSGSDIILGNHAHWIQPIEIYKGKYIIYAQGNTIFDQDWSLKTREGVLYKFEYKGGKFNLIDEKYTIIDNNSQPRFADETETKRIKSYVSF